MIATPDLSSSHDGPSLWTTHRDDRPYHPPGHRIQVGVQQQRLLRPPAKHVVDSVGSTVALSRAATPGTPLADGLLAAIGWGSSSSTKRL